MPKFKKDKSGYISPFTLKSENTPSPTKFFREAGSYFPGAASILGGGGSRGVTQGTGESSSKVVQGMEGLTLEGSSSPRATTQAPTSSTPSTMSTPDISKSRVRKPRGKRKPSRKRGLGGFLRG